MPKTVETVTVKCPDRKDGVMIINKSDFDAEVHTLARRKPASKATDVAQEKVAEGTAKG